MLVAQDPPSIVSSVKYLTDDSIFANKIIKNLHRLNQKIINFLSVLLTPTSHWKHIYKTSIIIYVKDDRRRTL